MITRRLLQLARSGRVGAVRPTTTTVTLRAVDDALDFRPLVSLRHADAVVGNVRHFGSSSALRQAGA